ncbi:GP63-like [Trichomonas vaginalis G3]|uniref:GP63-like n=1 Tax=Trichomonas vaginalis (strain ATCC PRA-98 / G3) TaxID=412133 RepID=A2EMT3_TRIV3|nr:regulation of choline O-acetyltransferase protein [Trichomonas vaginalis G3]EAY06006.1 GP63-like [Trichomonas vaginalis G3]KAI5512795.1 regulation of choline O-acetyltransferase protein [Trichomonas vaginalis G3]|eukprot:XP_001318229.1 GP63-like [Trichomonas vaginalis G3]
MQRNGDLQRKVKYATDYPDFRPIKLKFNYDWLDPAGTDRYLCREAGVDLHWHPYVSGTCTEENLMTEEKKKNFIGTLENCRKFLEKNFQVRPLPRDTIYIDSDGVGMQRDPLPVQSVTGCDMHFIICGRAYNGLMAASAKSYQTDMERGERPIQGVIFLNTAVYPTMIEDEDTPSNHFYHLYLHEIFHALGCDSFFMNLFHPIDDYAPYRETKCSLIKGGKQFTFLVTPFCHKWAMKHYNVEYYYGDNNERCLSGVELEDAGDDGAIGSHPKLRAYIQDLMTSNSLSQAKNWVKFTDLTMAILLDTGNYKINYTAAQPLLWGNKDSIDGVTYLTGFPIESPQISFPKYYLMTGEQNEKS